MAQVTITVDAGITVEVIEAGGAGDQIAALTAQLATRTGERDALQGKLDAAITKIDALSAADLAEDAARAELRASLL